MGQRQSQQPTSGAHSRGWRGWLGGSDTKHDRQTKATPGRGRRLTLVPFALGLALGYGLSGPLPGLVNGAVAGLKGGSSYLSETISPLSNKSILVMGIDKVGANTDVIFTLEINDGDTRLTQVPRDTYVESEHFGVLKANALYAFGGMDGARRELSGLLGEPIQRYLPPKA